MRLYWVAGLVSVYQAYRGWAFQRISVGQENRVAKHGTPPTAHVWSTFETVVLRCLADALLFLVCSVAGFVALFVAFQNGFTPADF